MLALPLMKSEPTGQFNITPLSSYLTNQKCYEEGALQTDLLRFQSLRSQAASLAEPSDANTQLLLHYYQQITQNLLPRFTEEVWAQEIKQGFVWTDALQLAKRSTVCSLHCEAAAVLWNLGALESLRGGRLDRSTDDGMRAAAKHFQTAAGYFDHITQTHMASLPPTTSSALPCLSSESLSLAKHLMLAQAQLCFYEKAVRDRKKDTALMKAAIIAKLASQVSLLYTQAATLTHTGTLTHSLDPSWFSLADFQGKSFRAACEYWQAMASKELALSRGTGYGEEVARLLRAEQSVRAALDVARTHANLSKGNLQSGAEALLQTIVSARTNALHDLQHVYLESVPNDSTLAEVAPVSMVKALPVSALLSQTQAQTDEERVSVENALFRFVLPREALSLLRSFYEDVSRTHTECVSAAETATQRGRETLSAVGLPASLESVRHAHSDSDALPLSLWQRIRTEQERESVTHLLTQCEALSSVRERARASLQMIREALSLAERQDDAFRARYPSYTGERVCESDREVRTLLDSFADALQRARENDDKLERDIVRSDAPLRVWLSGTREEIAARFSQRVQHTQAQTQSQTQQQVKEEPLLVDLLCDDTPSQNVTSATESEREKEREMEALEEKLHELAGLFEERERDTLALRSLGEVDLSLEMNNTLVRNKGESMSDIVQKHAQRLRETESKIKQSIERQERELLPEILRLNESFTRRNASDPILCERARVMCAIEDCLQSIPALQSQLNGGLTFYANLQSQLTTLQQNADDIAFTAQWQRQEFEASLSLNTHSAPVATASAQQSDLSSQFSQSVHVSPAPPVAAAPVASYSAYPALSASHNPSASAPTLTAPVAAPHNPPTQTQAQSMNAYEQYRYGQMSYSVLPNTPAQTAAPVPPAPVYVPASSAYPAVPRPPAVMGQPTTGPPSQRTAPLTAAEMDSKISRLMEMGFPRDSVHGALVMANWQEEAALNFLLAAPPSAFTAAPQPQQQQSRSSSGLFSGMWGKKK